MKYVLFITGFLTVFYSANAQFRDKTILYNLENMEDLRQFGSWAREIEWLFTSRNPLTVFAFNDTGYATMPSQEKAVLMALDAQGRKNYVRSFTVNQKFGIANLYDGQELDSVQGRKLFVNKKNVQTSWTTGTSRTFVNGGMIIREELQCSNGIIHVLERPLSPINNINVLEYIEESTREGAGKLNSLMDRLYFDFFSTAIAPLANEKKMTFFMPSQQSMERIPDQKLNALSGIQLAKTFQMHYIPKFAVFTNVVDNYQSFTSGNQQSQIIFHKVEERVSVSSGGVTAQIIRGNITLNNGVLHIIDRMLGFVYNTAIEQIGQDAVQFNNFIQTLSPETKQLITQSTGLNMFIPMDMAFTYVRNLPGINIDTNQTLKDMVVKMSIIRDGALTVTKMGEGNYESRQRRVSYYNNQKLVIYNDRNETWVNGGNTRAKVIRPDVGCTTGSLQYLDRLLGIPTMDIPTLIYYDDYLLLVYYEMVRVHLDEYLRDKNFDRTNLPPRGHEPTVYYGSSMGSQYGYNSGPGGQFQFTTMYPNQYPTFSPDEATQHPNNIPNSMVEAWYQSQGNYGGQSGNQGQYGNQGQGQYGNQGQNQYNQGQDPYGQNQGQNQYNQGQNQYGNQGQNQYGNQGQNQYGNQGQNQYNQDPYSQNSYGGGQNTYNNQFWCDFPCGDQLWGCKFTFFVPNGTALENFYFRASYAAKVINDACRFKFILRRLIIPHQVISLETMMVSQNPTVVHADTGELLTIRKESENDVRILWGQQSARVIMWDLGATNGIVHIIDQILSDQDDEWIDISGASTVVSSIGILLAMLMLTFRCIWR